MKIALDISPLNSGNFLKHRVRGTGFYLQNLKNSLVKYFPENNYVFFSQGEKLPNDTNIVHIPYFEPFFLTMPLRKAFKRVVTVHDLTPFVFPDFFPSGIKGKIKWQIQKTLLQQADRIITDSESSKKDIIKFVHIPDNKIDTVYLAADENFNNKKETEATLNIIKKKYNLPSKFALYVGDATWNKNLLRLMSALVKVHIPLVMAGNALLEKNVDINNPWNQDLIKAQKIAENNSLIKRIGFVSDEDLRIIYKIATVFVMPSLYEGFGLPIIEAMNSGCPVVTTKEGSLGEVGGDAALYVNAYDETSIAEGVAALYSQTSLQNLYSKKGLEQAKKFSWEKTAKNTVESYKKILL